MSRKMEVNRLDREELVYELTWRGIATGTVDEMRSRLVLARQMERTGESLHYPPYPFSFQEDTTEVTRKLDMLRPQVDIFADSSKAPNFLKLQTKINHILGRLDNMQCSTAEEFTIRGIMVGEALTLLNDLNSKTTQAAIDNKPVPINLAVLQGSFNQAPATRPRSPSFVSHDQLPLASTPYQCNPHGSCGSSTIKPILPHKWNIKFSGDRKGMSVTAFFEKVEELRRARNVSKDVLLDSGIDLFIGRAYEFYQDCRAEVHSWDELVHLFKEEYQPAFYAEKLLEEIKRRTQGSDESIGTYMAIMNKYFQRLQCPISEEAKLSILLRNIAPSYRSQLGALEINTIAELKSLCKRIEQRSFSGDCATSSRRVSSLEPDLAYVEDEPDISTLRVTERDSGMQNASGSKEIVCFRCKKPGHKAIGCLLPRPKHCFKCKKEGVTVKTCPKCNSGNAGQRS